jgi:hypothetical protein
MVRLHLCPASGKMDWDGRFFMIATEPFLPVILPNRFDLHNPPPFFSSGSPLKNPNENTDAKVHQHRRKN